MRNLKNRKFLTGTILLIAAMLFLLVNISSSVFLRAVNLDLTQNRLYTLSAGSKEIINSIPEPVILRMYFSRRLAKNTPYLLNYASRVQDLLVQYERAAKGKIIVEVIDPEPFSGEEDEAINFGLKGLPIDNSGTELYMGLIGINSVNTKIVIPFMQANREANLEYDISQLLAKLVNPQAKLVGVMSALPMQGNKETRPWAVWQQMAQSFELKALDTDLKSIPENINTLMVVEPRHFSLSALQALEKFVARGGHLIAFVDPFSEVVDPQLGRNNSADNSAEVNRLLRSWGLELLPNKVVADRSLAKTVRLQTNTSQTTVHYPLWVDLNAKNFDKNDVLTSTLERITMATPGALVKVADVDSKFTPLISTSSQAMLVDSQDIPEHQKNYLKLMENYKATGTYTLAARVTGPSSNPYNVIVIADSDMLHDHFWLSISNVMGQQVGVPTASNANFVLSALDNLSGSNALISIRNRGGFNRPFETIAKLEAKSYSRYRETEMKLQQRLDYAKRNLDNLAKQGAEQQRDQNAFRSELLNTRRELRDVRRKLNRDIDILQTSLKFVDIWLIPLLIVAVSLTLWSVRRVRCSMPKR